MAKAHVPAIRSSAFDAVASDYDAAFTSRPAGRWLREAVWEEIKNVFQPGACVLELGCGTGEDALWLAKRGVQVVATDAAPAMLDVARRKIRTAGMADRVSFSRLDLGALQHMEDGQARVPGSPEIQNSSFDGVLSNFGALNCLADRRPLARFLSRRVRPGGAVALVVMGPLCPWESAWHLAHGELQVATRRFRSGVVAHVGDGAYVRVWYPSSRRLRDEMAPKFRHVHTAGIGALLPPSQLGHLVERWPGFFEGVALIERRFRGAFPWTWLNDHYVAIFERV